MKHFIPTFCIIIASFICHAQDDSLVLKGLQNDIYLHPMDGFTAYTLKKNEVVYNQSPFTLPLPSWAWWGITDRLTAEIDLLPLVGGLFVDPHIPVPSFNFRYKLKDQNGWKPTMALEIMYQHLWNPQNQLDQEGISIDRNSGNSGFFHFNSSWYNQKKLRFHFSAGFTYTENLNISYVDSTVSDVNFFKNTFNPDVSLSLDYRTAPWISLHFTTSYGSTFVYLDNIPRKYQISYGFRIAPFYKSRFGFFRTFRAEFAAFYFYFADINKSVASLVPIFPYLYWQWTFGKKTN